MKEPDAGYRFTEHPNGRAVNDPSTDSGTRTDHAPRASRDDSHRPTAAPTSPDHATASADDDSAFGPDADRPAHECYSAGGWR
jgi:hypothetical protein